MPGAIGMLSPQIAPRAIASRLGARAVSSSVLAVDGWGKPPRPSRTRRTILLGVSSASSAMSSNGITGVDSSSVFGRYVSLLFSSKRALELPQALVEIWERQPDRRPAKERAGDRSQVPVALTQTEELAEAVDRDWQDQDEVPLPRQLGH